MDPGGSRGGSVPFSAGGEPRLAGHGDFDGDGRAELLWRDGENGFALGSSDPRAPGTTPSAPLLRGPEGFELLAIADVNGDGLDDLVGRGVSGALVMALAVDGGPTTWQAGSDSTTAGLDLLATLDLDDDGSAEIAFLNGDIVEIWSPESGLQDSWQL